MNYFVQVADHFIGQFIKDESGQDLIEYALITGLVGLGATLGLKNLTSDVKGAFNTIGTTLNTTI
jgi:pilus assembly protein Flp/PilA